MTDIIENLNNKKLSVSAKLSIAKTSDSKTSDSKTGEKEDPKEQQKQEEKNKPIRNKPIRNKPIRNNTIRRERGLRCPRCGRCSQNVYSKRISMWLDKQGIKYEAYSLIPESSDHKYMFYLPDTKTIIEYDDERLFDERLHAPIRFYKEHKKRVMTKWIRALQYGYKMIRIASTENRQLEKHLANGIISDKPLYLSSDIYERRCF